MQIGIVGLPFSGKSTLFQTITKTHLDDSPLGKTETHHAIIRVPDHRLETLRDIFRPQSTVFATIEFVDIVGLQMGDSGSTQFTTNFLANVRLNDAFIQVVRQFENATVPRPDGTIDMMRDINTLETEFILSDLMIIENRIERIKKQFQKSGGEALMRELPLLEECQRYLQSGTPLREVKYSKDALRQLKSYQLLSLKPMLIALNLDETQIEQVEELAESVRKLKTGKQFKVFSFLGKLELEMSKLTEDEAQIFLGEYGIKESALDTLIRESYDLLGLRSFFTVGDDECRAWTIQKNMTAQEASGVIHSSFINKFIRAEVVHYDFFIEYGGSFDNVKKRGLWRLEGKNYIVKDGDIVSIRHS